MERICTLPFVSQDFPKCLAWIDKNYNVLIQLLNSSYTPAIVCSLLGFCVLEHNEKVVVKVNDNIELIVPGEIDLVMMSADSDLQLTVLRVNTEIDIGTDNNIVSN